MNLSIKDLSTSTELDRAAMTAVHGGTGANGATQVIGQVQQVSVPVGNGSMFGPGSSTNLHVDVDADQHASNRNYQYNGDSFGILLAPFLRA
jgi:hypothetical protein